MLSRVAESIYWMARYIERAENLARFIDVTLNLILDQPTSQVPQWEPLVNTTGDEEFFKKHYGVASGENVIRFLTSDAKYSNSILSVLRLARENGRTVRESISSEAWEELNEFYHYVNAEAKSDTALNSPSDYFRNVKQHAHLFNGILDATLSHDAGWHFANLGRLMERADKTSRILDVKYFTLLPSAADVGTTIDDLGWSAVLRSVSGFEMYRRRFRSLRVKKVVDFLILDRAFPRAVQFCLSGAEWSMREITGSQPLTYRNAAERRLGSLKAELAYTDVYTIIARGLHQFIDDLQTKINSIGEGIHETFFAIRPVENTQSQLQKQA
ncbi:MAG: alpha-E domain-containing protein [Pirellulaceae bacterium]|nr:alpha-E domain-containing protein [Pirellulaceae bacterium]